MIGIVADIHIYHSLIITNHEDILHLFLVQSRQCTDGQNRFVPIQQRAAQRSRGVGGTVKEVALVYLLARRLNTTWSICIFMSL